MANVLLTGASGAKLATAAKEVKEEELLELLGPLETRKSAGAD